MVLLNNITEVQEWMRNRGPKTAHGDNFASGYSHEVMRDELMPRLGDPQNNIKVIHVAGTSGKGSVVLNTSRLLALHGHRVFATVSPFILEFRERFQILDNIGLDEDSTDFEIKKDLLKQYSNTFIDEQKLVSYANELAPVFEKFENEVKVLSYYEIYIAMVFYIAAAEGVDYAVIEVGLGGRLDATNVVSSEEKVCVINDIGLDHQGFLGDTVEIIAGEKAGIITAKNKVFKTEQSDNIDQVFRTKSETENASLEFVNAENNNIELATKAAEYLAERDNFEYKPELVNRVENMLRVGRVDRVTVDGREFIIDGAHNEQKIEYLVNSLERLYGSDQKFNLVWATKATKDATANLKVIKHLVQSVVVYDPGETDEGAGSIGHGKFCSTAELEAVCQELGLEVTVASSLETALETEWNDDLPVLITGTIYSLDRVYKKLGLV